MFDMFDIGVWNYVDREDFFVENRKQWGEIEYNNKSKVVITIYQCCDIEFIEILDKAYDRLEKLESHMDHSAYNTIAFNKLEYEQNGIIHLPDIKVYLLSENSKFAEILYSENNISFKIYKNEHSYYSFEYCQFIDTLDKAYKEFIT